MSKTFRKAIVLRSKLKDCANKSKVTRDIKMYKQQLKRTLNHLATLAK